MDDLNRTFRDKLSNGKMKHKTLKNIVANTFTYALSCGISEQQIEKAVGLERSDLINSELYLPEEFPHLIWKLIAKAHPGKPLTLHLASGTPLSGLCVPITAMQFAENLRATLQVLVRYRLVLSDRLEIELIDSGSESILRFYHPLDDLDGGYCNETAVSLFSRYIQQIVGIKEHLLRVEFSHFPLGLLDDYEQFFGVPVSFGQPYTTLVFRMETLDLPTQQPDSHPLAYVQENLNILKARQELLTISSPLSELQRAITRCVESGHYSVEAVARQINTSPRALQRQAQEQGFTIRQLLDEARQETALRLIPEPILSITNISNQLGYSDVRAFRRAFKRWTGKSPTQFRRDSGSSHTLDQPSKP